MWELLLAAILATVTVESPAPRPSLDDLPQGAPPSVGYVVDGEWRGPDRRRVELSDRHGISSVTAYDGGFLVADTRYFEGSLGLSMLDGAGRPLGRWASSGSPAVSGDGRAAWTSFVPLESGLAGSSQVHVDDGSGRVALLDWAGRAPFSVTGFVGDRVVVDGAFSLPVALLAPDCSIRELRRLATGSDATDRWVAGSLVANWRRSGVVDAATGAVLWRTPADGLMFSPSGRRVVGETRDGLTVFRSSDGNVLWRAELPRRGYTGPLTWEDERHILAVTQLRNETAVLRFGRGDAVERATSVSPSDVNRPPYVLATR